MTPKAVCDDCFYSVLGVDKSADDIEIKKAYVCLQTFLIKIETQKNFVLN